MKNVFMDGLFVLWSIGLAIPALGWWAAPVEEVMAQPGAAESLRNLLANPGEVSPLPQEPVNRAQLGAFVLLTYNTAGLPPFINGLNDIRHFDIGWRLNAYDLALVQEDFLYHDRLTYFVGHEYQSPLTFYHQWWHLLLRGRLVGDGLHRFTTLPFAWVERYPWAECNGLFDASFDCLALKGFSVSTHVAALDVAFDVYNLHMDAGGSPGDGQARMIGLEQIRQHMEQRAARPGMVSQRHPRIPRLVGQRPLRSSAHRGLVRMGETGDGHRECPVAIRHPAGRRVVAVGQHNGPGVPGVEPLKSGAWSAGSPYHTLETWG